MFLLFPLLAAIISVPLVGGDLRQLAHIRFRHAWLLLAALATQVWLVARPGPQTALLTALELGAFPLGLAFLWFNRRIPGIAFIALGAGMNFIAIVANGGIMPAAPEAIAAAGIPADYGDLYANSAALAHPRLLFLGDIFAIPAAFPLSNVFSIGDVLIALGGIVAILRITLEAKQTTGNPPREVDDSDRTDDRPSADVAADPQSRSAPSGSSTGGLA